MGSSMSNPLRFSVYDDGSGDVITSKSDIELFSFEDEKEFLCKANNFIGKINDVEVI